MTEASFDKPPLEFHIQRLKARLHALRFRGYHRAAEGYGGWEVPEVADD